MEPGRWRRVQELFEAALQLDPAARLLFLKDRCGDEPDLLEEVSSLIEADEKGRPFLDSLLPAAIRGEGLRLLPGEMFRHYRIVGRIGAGGMGIVYKAIDTRLDRAVALKFLSEPLVADQKVKDRFVIEAKAASRLDHPNICTIYEIGNLEEDALFISMAFCEGRSVAALIEGGRVPPDRALSIVMQVADGLGHAHDQRIIHRDIKPANVIVTPDDIAKIIDFGIAKLPGTQLTDADAKIGTLAYMAPEQLKGEAADHRADLWSLGVMLYELLTGRHPFAGEDPATTLHAVLHSDSPPLSHWLPGWPAALDRIGGRALARDAGQRYQRAGEFLADLDELRCLGAGARVASSQRPPGLEGAAGHEVIGHGAAVAQEVGPVSGPYHSRDLSSSSAGELRQVTVVIADICDFAGLSLGLEPEDAHHLLERYVDAVDETVARYGGIVDKHIGASVMAVFGAPRAHDNDCERALMTAAEIHRRVTALGEDLAHSLQVQVGIACGRQVAGSFGKGRRSAYTITGHTVDLAARLAELAEPGETLISDPVYRAASGLLEVEVKQHPLSPDARIQTQIWRVVGARERPTPQTGSFVGRRAELRQMTAIMEDCQESGRGAVVFLRGQAGIGKTRLVAEFQAVARRHRFRCHTGLVLDFGVAEGQDAIGALVRSFLEISPNSTAEERQEAAQAATVNGLIESEQQVFLNDLLNIPQPDQLRSIYDAMDNAVRNHGKQSVVSALLAARAAQAPVLVAVEDIHWADALTLEYLAAMATVIADCRGLLIITSRIEGDPLGPEWQGAIHDTPLISIMLAPLRSEEAERLASGFMDTSSVLAHRCIARAEGNPLFLEQLLRSAQETPEEDVPSTIRSLVLSRLDRLSAPDKAAIRAASAIGQRFQLDALRYLLDQPDYDCQGLLQHYLLRPQGRNYLFAHALIQGCIYGSMLKPQKRRLHRRAADWFAGRDAGLHAEHLDRAEDAAAPKAYLEAAQAQMLSYHYDQALQLVERGLVIVRAAEDRFQLNCLKGELLRELGSVAESLKAFAAALSFAETDAQRCRAWIGQAGGMRLLDDYGRAFEALDLAQAVAVPHRLTQELAQLHYLRGSLFFPLGKIDACREQHEAALENARRAGSAEREALALSGLGDAAYARGRMYTAQVHFRDCLELCTRHGFGRIEAANRFMSGTVRIYLNELEGALEDSLSSAELAARVGNKRAEIISRLTAGWILIDRGELDHARQQAELGLAIAHSLGARRFKPFLSESLARIRLAEGDGAAACALLESALVEVRQGSAMAFIGPWLLGSIALATDDPEQRRASLAEGEEVLANGCVGHNHYRFYQAAMEAMLEAQDWSEAGRYADALEAYTRPEPVPWAGYYIARTRALSDFGRGLRSPGTLARLADLLDQAERIGLRSALPLLARALEQGDTRSDGPRV